MITKHPTIFVIFGVTGDLARKKLFSALFNLFSGGYFPDQFKIVGVGRREFTPEVFKQYVLDALKEKNISAPDSFLSHFEYVHGQFDDVETFKALNRRLGEIDTSEFKTCSNKLYYLSVPPTLFTMILSNIERSGLTIPCSDGEGWTRVLVEKPFGENAESAHRLDEILGEYFKEEQIFRIDHYLAKETVQNILTFRFSNTLFEPLWNKKHIESVSINMFESNTAEERNFYHNIGALRDVGQNHLLQMLALIAMEPCESMNHESIRHNRAEVFKKLKVGTSLMRAQYEGFALDEESDIETFFSFEAEIPNKRWKGVPFYVTSGKALSEDCVEIVVHFKDNTEWSFMPEQYEHQECNTLTFSIQPKEGISIMFWAKIPGFEQKIEPRTLSFTYHDPETNKRHIDAYEKVIYDCIVGDQTLFASTDEV